MAENISLKLTGAPIAHPNLPSALRPATRSADGARVDEFLPDGYLKITSAFEVGQRVPVDPRRRNRENDSSGR